MSKSFSVSVLVVLIVLAGSLVIGQDSSEEKQKKLLELVIAVQRAHAELVDKFGPEHPETQAHAKRLVRLQAQLDARGQPVPDWDAFELRLVVSKLQTEVRLLRARVALLENPPARTELLQ